MGRKDGNYHVKYEKKDINRAGHEYQFRQERGIQRSYHTDDLDESADIQRAIKNAPLSKFERRVYILHRIQGQSQFDVAWMLTQEGMRCSQQAVSKAFRRARKKVMDELNATPPRERKHE